MKIDIHGRLFNPSAKPYIQQLFDELSSRKVSVQVSIPFFKTLQEADIEVHTEHFYQSQSDLFQADYLLSLGGDGTLLEAVTHVGNRAIPILGINTGRLGFLAAISPENIGTALLQLFNKEFTIEQRSLISVEAGGKPILGGLNFGLNELGIQKTDTSSMITIKSYLDGEFLNTYWADGLIVSTPTGSTGYCLSVGGPLVMPQSENFVIAPMSPHNLNVRPLVISDNSTMTFEVESRSSNFLISLDSRYEIMETFMQITACKAPFYAHLVKMNDTNFLNTLRSKLSWGHDVRN